MPRPHGGRRDRDHKLSGVAPREAARRAVARDLGSQRDGACLAEPKEAGPFDPAGLPGVGPLFEQWGPRGGPATRAIGDARPRMATSSWRRCGRYS